MAVADFQEEMRARPRTGQCSPVASESRFGVMQPKKADTPRRMPIVLQSPCPERLMKKQSFVGKGRLCNLFRPLSHRIDIE